MTLCFKTLQRELNWPCSKLYSNPCLGALLGNMSLCWTQALCSLWHVEISYIIHARHSADCWEFAQSQPDDLGCIVKY